MLKTLILVLGLTALMTGCATKQGIALPTGSGPTKEDIEAFNARNRASASASQGTSVQPQKDVVQTALVPDPDGPRVVIIGNVMALTVFDESTLNARYDAYLKQLAARSAPPTFSRDWYVSSSAGETAVKFSGVTGIYTRFFKAEIPKDLIRQISFASAFGTFMVGTSGDLVAAERSTKNGTWVTRLLCSEKSPDYSACEALYPRGIYQGADGKEIDDKLQLVASGKTIDPVSYRAAGFIAQSRDQPRPLAPQASRPEPTPATPAAVVPVVPVVSTLPMTTPPVSPPAKDLAAQLQKLNELRAKGLVTEDEYQRKRKEILDSL